mmetsp:Transcript_73366/g.202478  ORF Transcript_73366/g.202478 Transcript_73366/m.202478 type:complete len:202 (-) Transcript_73366:1504-2109(-)
MPSIMSKVAPTWHVSSWDRFATDSGRLPDSGSISFTSFTISGSLVSNDAAVCLRSVCIMALGTSKGALLSCISNFSARRKTLSALWKKSPLASRMLFELTIALRAAPPREPSEAACSMTAILSAMAKVRSDSKDQRSARHGVRYHRGSSGASLPCKFISAKWVRISFRWICMSGMSFLSSLSRVRHRKSLRLCPMTSVILQ